MCVGASATSNTNLNGRVLSKHKAQGLQARERRNEGCGAWSVWLRCIFARGLLVEYNVNALQDQSEQILRASHNYANFVRKLTAR